jgi:hypothetical protein
MISEFIPQISLGGAALILFAICAGLVLFRGIARMILGTATLCLCTWLGFQVWQCAPSLSVQWIGRASPWITNGLPLSAWVASWLLIRKIRKIITRPFGRSDEAESSRSAFGIGIRLLIAMIPAALIWLAGAVFIYHRGSIDEVREVSRKHPNGSNKPPPSGWIQDLKTAVEATVPRTWLDTLDPSAEPSRLALAKFITTQSKTPLKPVINPQTGLPFPRAILVEDPELQKLARDGKFGTLLRHPLLTKALADPTIQKLLREFNL